MVRNVTLEGRALTLSTPNDGSECIVSVHVRVSPKDIEEGRVSAVCCDTALEEFRTLTLANGDSCQY